MTPTFVKALAASGVLLVIILSFLTGHSDGESSGAFEQGQTIRIGTPILPEPLPPSDVAYLEHFESQRVVTEPLLLRDRHDNPRPRLAKSVALGPDYLTVTLRPDLKFSDGSPIRSDDIVWSFEQLLKSKIGPASLLSRCLGIHAQQGLVVQSATVLKITTPGCDPARLLEELASPNYAVLKMGTFYGKNPRDLWQEPVSGMYRMQQQGAVVRFVPNEHHHLYKSASSGSVVAVAPILEFHKVTPAGVASADAQYKLDLFKTISAEVREDHAAKGYASAMSPPVMAWFLSSDRMLDNAVRKPTDDLILRIKSEGSLSLPYFNNNPHEGQAASFFPADFGCDKSADKKPASARIFSKETEHVVVVGHSSGESDVFGEEVAHELRRLGLQADHRSAKDDAHQKSPGTTAESKHRIAVYRQFLGPDFLTTFQLIFKTFRTITDHAGGMGQLLARLDSASRDEQDLVLRAMCQRLSGHPFVPLAHRKVSFVARRPELLRLTSPASGYFSLASVTGWDEP